MTKKNHSNIRTPMCLKTSSQEIGGCSCTLPHWVHMENGWDNVWLHLWWRWEMGDEGIFPITNSSVFPIQSTHSHSNICLGLSRPLVAG